MQKKTPKSAEEEEEVFFDEHEPQRELNDSMPSMKYINQPCASYVCVYVVNNFLAYKLLATIRITS